MPNYFKKDWLEEWKTERKMGRTKWSLTHGIGFTIIAIIVDALVNNRKIWEMEPAKVIQTLAIYFVGGVSYALFSWWFNERKLNQEKNKRS
jgi:mannosyltransferase OCH1-like enzyme